MTDNSKTLQTENKLYFTVQSNLLQLSNTINYFSIALNDSIKLSNKTKHEIKSNLENILYSIELINKEINCNFKNKYLLESSIIKIDDSIKYLKTLYPSSFKSFFKPHSLECSYCEICLSIAIRLKLSLQSTLKDNFYKQYLISLESFFYILYSYLVFLYDDSLVVF